MEEADGVWTMGAPERVVALPKQLAVKLRKLSRGKPGRGKVHIGAEERGLSRFKTADWGGA